MLTKNLSILQRLIIVELLAIGQPIERRQFVDSVEQKIETESSWEIEPAYDMFIEEALNGLIQMEVIQEIEGKGEHNGKKFIGWINMKKVPT